MTAPEPTRSGSTSELAQQLYADIARLVRDELKLAGAEMTRKGAFAAKGIGLFGGSGLVALLGVGCLVAVGVIGLAQVLAAWLAALLVGAVLLAVAGVAALGGKRELSAAAPPLPEQVARSIKADMETVRHNAGRL